MQLWLLAPQHHPFTINLSAKRMTSLVANTQLPAKPEYPGLANAFGIDLDVLKNLANTWSTTYSWEAEQAKFNKYDHYTATIEGLTIHFIHQKSGQKDAIPLILNHGWPETFQDFLPLVAGLTGVSKTPGGKSVSFDVIIPSLPGFTFSSAPPANWTLDDTARVFNTLMTEVLGYTTYAAFGTDWGSAVAYSLYGTYNTTVRALALDYLPFFAIPETSLEADNITLDSFGVLAYQLYAAALATGTGYFVEQNTEPNTIGLALYDNPVGQLAWIADKVILWSDPRAGTNGSLITPETTLNTVSLYYLTGSFVSSVFTYAQNPNGFKSIYSKAPTDAPLLFSAFQYNNQYWPPAVVAMVGNLTSYTEHTFGGHFSGLDNPSGLLSDLIKIGDYYQTSHTGC
ncbi:Alpha/Beta hydrolase protein [Mycena maculata]|uniref:Alpha/Beta hydrolase protein n=1 Tax=Mycena maculata TaxID=230809 RepID=A0AAD7J7Y7_9AGAR|nr:Alpha/Beta hydrolase protein [Mycena maculata]